MELGHLVGLLGLEESVKERNTKGLDQKRREGGREGREAA